MIVNEIKSKMNYNISFSDMNRLASHANSKKPNVSLNQMRKQASQLKSNIGSKVKKRQQSEPAEEHLNSNIPNYE